MHRQLVSLIVVMICLTLYKVLASDTNSSLEHSASETPSPANITALDRVAKIEMAGQNQSGIFSESNPGAGKDSVATVKCEIVKTLCVLNDTIIPKVEFHDARIGDVLDFISSTTRLPILLLPVEPPSTSAGYGLDVLEGVKISLSLHDVSAARVLRLAGVQSNHLLRIGPSVIAFSPIQCFDGFRTNQYFIPRSQSGSFEKETLKSKGIGFPPGSGIAYSPSTEILVVRNSEINLELIEGLRDELLLSPGPERRLNLERESEQISQEIVEWKQELTSMIARDVKIQNASMEEVSRELRLKLGCFVGTKLDSKAILTVSMKNSSAWDLLERIANTSKSRVVIGSFFVVFLPVEMGTSHSL